MFTTKQKSLFPESGKTSGSGSKKSTNTNNGFINSSLKSASSTTSLGNGAMKFTTTGNDFVDQFGKATNYKQSRKWEDISKDMSVLWGQSPEMAVRFTLYLRMITRVTVLNDGSKTETTQRGQGLKHEGIMRMIWIAIWNPDVFWQNIDLFISVGSWNDIFKMLENDLIYNGLNTKLNHSMFNDLVVAGLENPNTSELVKKYLPRIKSNTECKTVEAQASNIIAKNLAKRLGLSYKEYRKLKTSGKAHEWQKLISTKKLVDIDFNTIHGRALSKLVSGKFLKNAGLESVYQKWIESKPLAKYTGYVYELFVPLGTSTTMSMSGIEKHKVDTMNKQFLNLVDVAKKGLTESGNKFIGVLDTSSSMTSTVQGTKVSSYSVGKSLCLFMSYILEGTFANHYLEFSDYTIMKSWKGDGPCQQLCNDNSSIIAGTNFQSVAEHFNKILKKGVPESDFPNGIVCFSDGCFDSSGSNKTNFKTLLSSLKNGGFSKEFVDNFKVILWDIPNGYYGKPQTAFEDFADCPNLFHVSGLDASALAFLTGVKGGSLPKNSEELFEAAMNQEVLNYVTV